MPARGRFGLALGLAVVILAALLVVALTLPILPRSKTGFFLAAGVGWTAVFAATGLLTRAYRRISSGLSGSPVCEPLSERADVVSHYAVADADPPQRVTTRAAGGEKRLD